MTNGTTALITGANRGLGYETARQLAARGWTVLLGSRDLDAGTAAAEKLAAEGTSGGVHAVQLDVTDDASVEAAAAGLSATYDRLDVLVNNAGITGSWLDPLETGPQDYLAVFSVNLLGPVRVTRAFLPLLWKSELPRLVMVSSGVGSLGVMTDPEREEASFIKALVYPSSKAALNMVTVQYAKALPGWKVNAVDPGYTATDMNDHQGHKTVEEGARSIVRAATLGADGPTGAFLDDDGTVPW
jgi:NAD(P)-dependent dehydrogenase (short-subunit alcohol dehydrogenase family)